MSQDKHQDQPHVVGEMFDAANISQPVPFHGIPGGITPDNLQQPASLSTDNNGFTVDDVQPPAPAPQPTKEDSDE